MKQSTLTPIADAINEGKLTRAKQLITQALTTEPGIHWQRDLSRLVSIIDNPHAPFAIIAKGNSKLSHKFLAFSTLPATKPGGLGCPGAGGCVQFCYSRKAWRYPAAFARQAQNTILMQSAHGRKLIADNVTELAQSYDTLRLYVDGDFSARPPVDNRDDVAFWFDLVKTTPINAYGYSKSHKQILAYSNRYPTNYKLNVSSGHNVHGNTINAIRRLPITRGDFIAVTDIRAHKSAQHGDTAHRQRLARHYKQQTGRKAFTCPGACNTCTPRHGHACGSSKFDNVDIIIAAH